VTDDLRGAIRARAADALARGALAPIPTVSEVVEQAGVRFVVRVLTSMNRRQAAATNRPGDGARPDPFARPDPLLRVCDAGDSHVCLLNKFPSLAEHALLVTRTFEEQESALSRADLAAACWALGRMDGLVFFNAGPDAGASQRRKHLQLVPTPLGEGPERVPSEPLICSGGLPFLHACTPLPPGAEPDALLACYWRLLGEVGLADARESPARPGGAYNLLLTRAWMLLVPRSRECWRDVPVNALGFAGALLVRDRPSLERVRAAGPLTVLTAVVPPAA
jgi:ATP adenylyltransferase